MIRERELLALVESVRPAEVAGLTKMENLLLAALQRLNKEAKLGR